MARPGALGQAQRRLLSALGTLLTAEVPFAVLLRFARQLQLSHFAKDVAQRIEVEALSLGKAVLQRARAVEQGQVADEAPLSTFQVEKPPTSSKIQQEPRRKSMKIHGIARFCHGFQ